MLTKEQIKAFNAPIRLDCIASKGYNAIYNFLKQHDINTYGELTELCLADIKILSNE